MTREMLPDRRKSWIQKVKIDGQTFYLDVGQYPDGRPGEIFIRASKYGTFVNGILDTLARSVSLLIQEGVPIDRVVSMLQGQSFPPNGQVIGSPVCSDCTSVPDWISSELAAVYLSGSAVGAFVGFARTPTRSGV